MKIDPLEQTRIEELFAAIPGQELVQKAHDLRAQAQGNDRFSLEKTPDEKVTEADLLLQKLILQYFESSWLHGSYLVKAEERIEHGRTVSRPCWQLIVDPLDGTHSYIEGNHRWGIMVGLCDELGELVCSWNITSEGAVFASASVVRALPPSRWADTLHKGRTLNIDAFDYGLGRAHGLTAVLKDKFQDADINIVSNPSAVWAGWELWCNNLDGLFWLPSSLGKRMYPDYDLVFLGPLRAQGWRIRLGRCEDVVNVVAVAPGDEELEALWQAAADLLKEEMKGVHATDELLITSGI